MRLIVDSNRIIAALIRGLASRKILLSDEFELITIGLAKEEIEEHRTEILKKAKLTNDQLESLLLLFFSRVSVISDDLVKTKMGEAKRIMDKIDRDDTPFVALALAVENKGIWSEDKHFQKQFKIKVWKTHELLKLINY